MAEELIIPTNLSKEEQYQELLPQLKGLVHGESDVLANIANIISALKYTFNWLWVGVYFVKGEELVLGSFQGPIACTRIPFGKGICGLAWKNEAALVVPDVNQFSGHISCNAASKSEIVIPVFNKNKEVALVLDIDSSTLHDFDEVDKEYLSKVTDLIASFL